MHRSAVSEDGEVMAIFKGRGDKYVPGSGGKRVVRGDTGETITKYKSESDAAKALGARNQSSLSRAMKELHSMDPNSKGHKLYQQHRAQAVARGKTNAERREIGKEFDRRAAAVRAEGKGGAVRDTSPTGPLAQYNNVRGVRPSNSDYAVGDSPSVR
jgi:hypothetical protein